MKRYKYWSLCLAIWLGIVSLSCAQNKNTTALVEDEKLIEFTTDRFTLPNLYVTPDKKHIIFDVLGDIYQVPIEGGKADVLLQDNNWKRAGKLSPNGKTLTYVSDETGEFQVWTMNLETKEKQVYPIKDSQHYPLNAYWKDDRYLLIPSKEGLQSFDIITRQSQIIRPALAEEKSVLHTPNRTMSVNNTGEYAFFQKNGGLWMYDLNKSSDLFIETIPNKAFLESIKGSLKGEKVLFYKKNEENDSKQDLISWDLSTKNLHILNTTQILGSSTTLNYSFDIIDDNTIILDKEGAIIRMNTETGEQKLIPIEVEVKKIIKKPLHRKPQYIRDSIITASVLRNPVTRKDLDTIYFGAFGKLHSYAKATGVIAEIYPDENRFEVSPSLSPDGKYLAYTTWNDTEMGHVYVREIKTGKEHQITQTHGRYINPAWSPDGTELVFVADETVTKVGIPGIFGKPITYNYHLDIHRVVLKEGGKNIKQLRSEVLFRVYPFATMPQRFYPIIVYHHNGESIFTTTRNHEKNLPVHIEIDLKTKEILQEKLIPFHTDEVLVAPNAKHIAFVFDQQVWVDSFPHALKLEFSESSKYAPKQLLYKEGIVDNILLHKAKSVYEIAPSYLYWQDEYTLMWGSAEEIYTYDVRNGKTEKIADIKVQRSRAIPKTQYALTNTRIITINKQDEIIEKGTILIRNNRIEAVGKVEEIIIPKDYKVFDLEGKTIMPGLVDVHSHLHLTPYEIINQRDVEYSGSIAYGVTTIYDPNANTLDYKEQAQLIEIGKIIGPRVFSSGKIIYQHPTNTSYYTLSTQEDANRLIKSFAKLGVSGPIKDYMISNSIQKRMLYNAALQKGYTITTDQYNYLPNIKSVLMGYTAFEHSIKIPIQRDIVKTISLSGINFTPTFVATPGIGMFYDKETEKYKLEKVYGKIMFDFYYGNKVKLKNMHIFQSQSYENLKNLINSDVTISVGGHSSPLAGIGTHWELWFMNNLLDNYEVLKAATINGAKKMDLQKEIGSIELGKIADLLILEKNPIEDIFNTIRINRVILNGVVFNNEGL